MMRKRSKIDNLELLRLKPGDLVELHFAVFDPSPDWKPTCLGVFIRRRCASTSVFDDYTFLFEGEMKDCRSYTQARVIQRVSDCEG